MRLTKFGQHSTIYMNTSSIRLSMTNKMIQHFYKISNSLLELIKLLAQFLKKVFTLFNAKEIIRTL